MRCEEVRSRIEESRLGLLPPDEQSAFATHVAACEACAAGVREAEAFESLLRHARDRERDAALVASLERLGAGRRRRARVVRALVGAAAAAALLVGVILLAGSEDARPEGELELAGGRNLRLTHAGVTALEPCRLRVEANGRRVALLSGAARFVVEPGHGPFAVDTPAGTIDVVGTEFEVRIMRNEAWAAGAVVVAAAVATGVVLFSNPRGEARVASQEIVVATPDGTPRKFGPREVARLLREKEALEREVRELRAAAVQAAPPAEAAPAEPGPGVEVPAESPVDPEVAEMPASIAGTDWDKMGVIIADLIAADDRGESTTSSPVLMLKMAYLLGRLRAIGKELGVADENEVFYHPRVAPLFFEGMIKAVFPELPEASRARVGEDILSTLATERARWVHPMLPVEKHARDLELAVRLTDAASTHLEPDQQRRLLRVVAADRPGGYSVSGIGQTSVEGLRRSMGGILVSSRKLTGPAAEEAHRLAGAFVDRHLAVRGELVRAHGEPLVEAALWGNREQAAELAAGNPSFELDKVRIRAKMIRVQAETERALLGVVPEETKREMLAGSLHVWLARLAGAEDR